MEERPFNDNSYEEFLNEEKLMGSRCQRCGKLFLPPRSICLKCYGEEMEWAKIEGGGKLIAFTCIAVGPPFMIEEGYDRKHPYCCGVVEFKEGVKIDARIVDVDASNPETLRIGTPVDVEYLHRDEPGQLKTFLAFRLSHPED